MDSSKLIRLRGPLRTSLKKAITSLKEELSKESEDYSEVEIRVKIESVRRKLGELSKKDVVILDVLVVEEVKEQEVEKEVLQAEAYQDDGYDEINRAERNISIRAETKNGIGQMDRARQGSYESMDSLNNNADQIKLPKLTLPKFSGEILEWATFWDQFCVSIHENVHLKAVQKFAYLKAQLTESAAKTIKGLPLTESNYQAAVQLLTERYGRKTSQIMAHSTMLINLTPVERSDAKSLRQLLDSFEVNIRGLETLNVTRDECGALLLPILLTRVPKYLRREWARYDDQESGNVSDFMKFFKKEVIAWERSDEGLKLEETKSRTIHQSDSEKKVSSTRFATRRLPPSATVYATNSVPFWKELSQTPMEERLQKVRSMKSCFNCLGKHIATECRSHYRCQKCNRKHHTQLHEACELEYHSAAETKPLSKRSNEDKVKGSALNDPVAYTANTGLSKTQKMTALVYVSNPDDCQELLARLLLDPGSDESFITKELAKKLSLEPHSKVYFGTETFGGKKNAPTSHNRVELHIRSRFNTIKNKLNLWEIENICKPIISYITADELDEPELADILENSDLPIDILIGGDVLPNVLIGGENKKTKLGVILLNSIFGWTVLGKKNEAAAVSVKQLYAQCMTNAVTRESEQIEKLWSLDSIGIVEEVEEKNVEEPPKYLGDRYEVDLPWRDERRPLANKYQASNRLRNILNLSEGDKALYEAYLEKWESNNIIEKGDESNNGFFLPHKVIKQKGKMRLVFDASAISSNSLSLNHCLQPGPNLVRDLCAILVNFRLAKYGVIADITGAFLQVQISEADRNYLKFLWVKSVEPFQVETYQFRRLPFGVTCGPYLLHHVMNYHCRSFKEEYPVVTDHLLAGTYVDDIVTCFDNTEEMIKFRSGTEELLKKAGMTLHGWRTSAAGLSSSEWNKEETKVLGIGWCPLTDHFSLSYKHFQFLPLNNKRDILSAVASLYDPMGMALPWTIQLRQLIQKLWISGLQWDQNLPDEIQDWCTKFMKQCSESTDLVFPRYTGVPEQLHIFCDASPKAYAACVYSVSNGRSTLLIAKARVTPVKKLLTLPRLELMAAVLGARLHNWLGKNSPKLAELSVSFWTDSMIALSWIRQAPDKWKLFVKNRVKEIGELTSIENWRHVKGQSNPADLATRGISLLELSRSSLWWEGPPFIREAEEQYETEDDPIVSLELVKQESKDPVVLSLQAEVFIPKPLLEIKNFSKLRHLIHIYSWMRRFIKNCKLMVASRKERRLFAANKQENSQKVLRLNKMENENALLHIIRDAQSREYAGDMLELKEGRRISTSSKLYHFNPKWCKEREVIVAQTRTREESLPIIPYRGNLSDLIIMEVHDTGFHQGAGFVISEIRRMYAIPSLKRLVKKVIHRNCLICKKFNNKPYSTSESAMPAFRVTPSRPFSYTGIDYCGPFYLQHKSKKSKCWILLMTCASTRAVHLEISTSLNEEETSFALRKFFARRGMPLTIYSDNATTFHALANALRINVLWKFIPEATPWWGGFWERMVGVMKRCLRKTLHFSSLSLSEFETVVTEAESMINRRPLFSTSEGDILTPAHFLYGAEPEKLISESASLQPVAPFLKCWKHRSMIVSHLWKRWRTDYLPTLRNWKRKSYSTSPPKPGDFVIIENSNLPRNRWNIGRIESLIVGTDGQARAAFVKMKGITTRRPLTKLVPLEVEGGNVQDCLMKETHEKVYNTGTENEKIKTRYGRTIHPPERLTLEAQTF